nr:hypothetical protein [uncultured Capnocytophaga sp.]
MKTVFKVGMEVYDQIYEPDVKGEVLDVNLDISPHPITVKFGSCVRYYTAEGCRGRNQIRTLSTSPYRIEGFEQKAPVPTFEEAEDWVKREFAKGNIFLMSKDVLEALRKLVILRDYYNEGWKPNWNESSTKYCIEQEGLDICGRNHTYNSRVMYFKTDEIRNKFLKEQRELLKIAKPLL